jgi:subtilisin family serine protease
LGPDAKPGPDWHGTGVTALLAGDTSSGTPGLIPDANFYVADVFRDEGNGEPASDTMSMLRALDWLDQQGVRVINMSLSGPRDTLLADAVKKLAAKGIVLVAAAGNEGPAAGPSYPAAYDDVIAVTAVGRNLNSYRYANRGSYIDVAAPGVAIWTAMPGSKEGYHSGTSFATPYVTAALAAISRQLPSATPAEVLKRLTYRDLGEPGPDPVYGQGLIVAPKSCAPAQVAKVARPATTEARAALPEAKTMPGASLLGSPESEQTAQQPAQGPEVLPWLTAPALQ